MELSNLLTELAVGAVGGIISMLLSWVFFFLLIPPKLQIKPTITKELNNGFAPQWIPNQCPELLNAPPGQYAGCR